MNLQHIHRSPNWIVSMSADKKVKPGQIERFLRGTDYPAKKKDLVETARRRGADQ